MTTTTLTPSSMTSYRISLRDLLAAHAPRKVPDWFHHQPAPGHPGRCPEPSGDDRPDLEDHEAYAEWSERYNAAWHAMAPEREDHARRIAAWKVVDLMARQVQWRWAWADAMLASRGQEVQS